MNELISKLIARIGGEGAGAAMVQELVLAAQRGDLCIPWNQSSDFPSNIISEGKNDQPFAATPLVFHKDRLYLQRNWALETLIVSHVSKLMGRLPPEAGREAEFQALLDQQRSCLAPSQFDAILRGWNQTLSIFAGGPGTGKTYTAAHFIRILASLHSKYTVSIAAPTGKAASRLEEVLFSGEKPSSLVCQTSTLHRLLSLRPGNHRLGAPKKLNVDLVVVDEASMLDHLLLAHLLEAIPDKGRLLLLGDANQLPPIESGSLFSEMANIFGSPLTQSHRMETGSLQEIADLICRADADRSIEKLKQQDQWISWDQMTMRMLAEWLKPEGRRILTPLRKGPFGVDQLNRELRQMLGWQNIPILIKQNAPKYQLWNGMSGVIRDKTAHFGERTLPVGVLPPYEEAFSISIHKSQGSEYDEVLVLFPPGAEAFGKEALYTAITRAKKKAIVASTEDTIRSALAQTGQRHSGFSKRIKL